MPPLNPENDFLARQTALDPARSFIVQAPAGSGKTELLTQRYLALLSRVQHVPEEILAITFTRKAAAEMQSRIINAIQLAAENYIPKSPHEQQTIQLAKEVLVRDQQEQWHLLNNPQRLCIQTIDAFCFQLVKQMPILSQFGSTPTITENPNQLYTQAVREVIAGLEDNENWSTALEQILLHLDNQQNKVEDLLIDMLARRDQWLPHFISADIPKLTLSLEESLQRVVIESIEKLRDVFPAHLIDELLTLCRYAAANLKLTQSESLICNGADLADLPPADLSARSQWLGIAQLLLTKEQEWRKKLTVNEGFPSASQAKNKEEKILFEDYKKRIMLLIEALKEHHYLRESFDDFVNAPPINYEAPQKVIINALLILLPILVAQLRIVFAQKATVDYCEITLRALQALGEPDLPTDLALILDYRIQHILMDEFQDTSISQYRLLERLTAGWQAHDGRTLFLVGDPMQSIYRFRKAEVGLFLRARQQGIGNINLESLILYANFRSDPALVKWTNQVFSALFPAQNDIGCGAISFSPSWPTKNESTKAIVQTHPIIKENMREEGVIITDIIQKTWSAQPEATIAILVRARQHLLDIIPALQAAKIPYRAVEIELLSQHSAIQDLLALTKALLHLADRTAWLAVLRAPWCGLTLVDIHAIASNNPSSTIWELINKPNELVSIEDKQRLQKLINVFQQSLAERRRKSLHEWVESTWLMLGGPACLNSENDLENTAMFFKLLENLDNGNDIADFSLLENQLNALTAAPQTTKTTLEIMTIHKAKGLEFDTVILPGLDRQIKQDDKPLLAWMERPAEHGNNDLILAPLKSTTAKEDLIYNYIRREENKKSLYEAQRLLYVAATRAKYQLHLVIRYERDNNNANSLNMPSSSSLLSHIWPHLDLDIVNKREEKLDLSEQEQLATTQNTIQHKSHVLKRLATDWTLPQFDIKRDI